MGGITGTTWVLIFLGYLWVKRTELGGGVRAARDSPRRFWTAISRRSKERMKKAETGIASGPSGSTERREEAQGQEDDKREPGPDNV
jgi:hypothetical protein